MARKPVTVAEDAVETVEVVVQEQAPAEEARPLSPQTLAEMEAGRKALAAHAASAKAETE
jgi:hypothetical protein